MRLNWRREMRRGNSDVAVTEIASEHFLYAENLSEHFDLNVSLFFRVFRCFLNFVFILGFFRLWLFQIKILSQFHTFFTSG